MGDQVESQHLNNRLQQIKILKQIQKYWKKPAQGAQALTSTQDDLFPLHPPPTTINKQQKNINIANNVEKKDHMKSLEILKEPNRVNQSESAF